ncbi:ATP12 family protein [Ferruginivarius sediminum]|uniref:ATPase n=1 Tax=Ferruginivarius sediminum TaxID=2661937 RepID=A0A369T8N5_9PROT|nr:ATP12 family protein [Ferruginivarius sediminum]RDD61663.1 ATPase [Ferruginivarius sediminum]
MAEKRIQRFYKMATARPANNGVAVLLDERPVKTPQTRADLVCPTPAMAEAVAAEWAEQGETVDLTNMPMTALACTALDTARTRREELVAGISKYADTDLLCYRVPEPRELAERQHALWQPLLDWAALTYDARLNVTTAILPAEQPPEATQALAAAVAELDDMRLAALSSAVLAAGSVVIGLAMVHGRIDAADAFEAAEVEATFQIEEWGEDAEAARRRAALQRELDAVERFVGLLQAA